MSVMDRVHRGARQQYVTARMRQAISDAQVILVNGGEPELALEGLIKAVEVARMWDYDETPAAYEELLAVYERCDLRSMALLNAVNWNVPVAIVMRAAGLEREL